MFRHIHIDTYVLGAVQDTHIGVVFTYLGTQACLLVCFSESQLTSTGQRKGLKHNALVQRHPAGMTLSLKKSRVSARP